MTDQEYDDWLEIQMAKVEELPDDWMKYGLEL